jgi:hypothetical protein
MTQHQEVMKFDGDFQQFTAQENKHLAERSYFNVRHAELVENRIPEVEEEKFQKTFTAFSQANNADLIKEIETQYPNETKAMQMEQQPNQATQAKDEQQETIKLSMRANRDGYSSIDSVNSRLAAIEERRKERLSNIEETPKEVAVDKPQAETKLEKPQSVVAAPSNVINNINQMRGVENDGISGSSGSSSTTTEAKQNPIMEDNKKSYSNMILKLREQAIARTEKMELSKATSQGNQDKSEVKSSSPYENMIKGLQKNKSVERKHEQSI